MVGEARIEVGGDTAWWVKRTLGDAGALEDGVFETEYASIGPLASWVLRQNGRAVPLEPDELREEVADACAACATATRGSRRSWPRETAASKAAARGRAAGRARSRPSASRVLQALLAYLLAACGEDREATLGARSSPSASSIPREELQEHLSLLNLVNFGGGCYTVYAELDGRHRARRQGALRRRLPLGAEADAARGAGDPARARVRRADDRRRRAHAARARAQEARGDVRAVRARADTRAASSTCPRSGS